MNNISSELSRKIDDLELEIKKVTDRADHLKFSCLVGRSETSEYSETTKLLRKLKKNRTNLFRENRIQIAKILKMKAQAITTKYNIFLDVPPNTIDFENYKEVGVYLTMLADAFNGEISDEQYEAYTELVELYLQVKSR